MLEILFKSLFERIWNLVKLIEFPHSLHGRMVPDINIDREGEYPVVQVPPPGSTRVQSLDDGGHITEDAGVHQRYK